MKLYCESTGCVCLLIPHKDCSHVIRTSESHPDLFFLKKKQSNLFFPYAYIGHRLIALLITIATQAVEPMNWPGGKKHCAPVQSSHVVWNMGGGRADPSGLPKWSCCFDTFSRMTHSPRKPKVVLQMPRSGNGIWQLALYGLSFVWRESA